MRNVNNPIVLYLILILSVIIVAAFVAAVLWPSVGGELTLPSVLSPEEVETGVRRLAAQSRGAVRRGEPMRLAMLVRTCRAAEKIVESKRRAGMACDDYETRFSENYYLFSGVMAELRRTMSGFSGLPHAGKRPALYEFLSYVVRSRSGKLGKDELKALVDLYNADRPLTWSEICHIKPMLSYVLLEQLTIYASKIIKRNELRQQAYRDAENGTVNEEHLRFNAYIKYISAFGDERLQEKLRGLCGYFGIDPDGADAVDAKLLAGYSGGLSAVTDSLRCDYFDTEYLLSLSVSAQRLESEPRVVFSRLAANTKADYMSEIERAARRRHISELDRVNRVIELAEATGKDIAHYIIRPPVGHGFLVVQKATVLLFSAAASVAAGFLLFPFPKTLFAILSFPVLVAVTQRLWLYLSGRIIPRRIVPEMRTENAPSTAILRCIAVRNADDVRKAFSDLETTAALNRESFFSYGLLFDCLNRDYVSVCEDISRFYGEICGKEHFFVCLRKNSWERKRGAILQFNDLVCNGVSEPFLGVWGSVRNFRYVVTLDADSELMEACRLVGMMEHPYHAEKTILSLGMRSKLSGLTTLFSRLMSGDRGLTHYDSSASDAVFDAYGFGSYTGKGIYRVKEFNERLFDAFPDGRILSHDLIEGAVAGCGNSGLCGLDDFPLTYSAYAGRQLRWMRGDLQLLPWLKRRVKDRKGKRRLTGIGSVAKWQMTMNIVAVIWPICSLAIMIACPVVNTFLPLVFAFLPQIADFLLSFGLWRHPSEVGKEQLKQIFLALQLPTMGISCLIALTVTAFRLITKRNLLCWRTYAAGKGSVCLFLGNLIVCAVAVVFGILYSSAACYVLGCVMLLVYPVNALLCRADRRTTSVDKEKSVRLARLTWNYFEETLTARNHYLPCDNFQEHKGWADRTSPTNIGMAISAAVCACEIGLISENRRDELIGHILTSLCGLESFCGLPYNWYEVESMRPLLPKYVSSVDCGNLMTSLLLVVALGGENGEKAQEYLAHMDMRKLYDEARGLLRIGYNVTSGEFDAGHYDLLGSEAALTYLVCAACGKIPVSAYAQLSRRTLKSGKSVLASWTGGMFEYLLPLMYADAPRRSLVGKSARNAARIHKAYAIRRSSDVYAMSESLYGAVNDSLDYRYKAFGVSSIALSPEKSRDVFAPYAAVMAADILDSDDGLNLLMEKYCGSFGLYDSVDLDAKSVQKSCMSHHQGMILLALADLICGGVVKHILSEQAEGRAMAVLLEENSDALRSAAGKPKTVGTAKKQDVAWTASDRTELPQLNYLTNGEYRLVIDAAGRNYQICNDILLSRFDRLSGLRVFLDENGVLCEPAVSSVCRNDLSASVFTAENKDLTVEIRAGVLFDANAEYRKIILKNRLKVQRIMSVIVVTTPCLTSREADLSHKAFSSMFVETGYDELEDYVFARRTNGADKRILALFSDGNARYSGDERSLRRGRTAVYGRTTEPVLAAKIDIVLPPHETRETTVCMAYGFRREIKAYRRRLTAAEDTVSMSVYASHGAMSARVRALGSYLLFARGRINGSLPCVSMSANKQNIALVLSMIEQLKTLKTFGVEFTTVIFYREPVSYYMDLSEKINLAVAGLNGCRIVNELTTDEKELSELKEKSVNLFGVGNRMLPPFYRLPTVFHASVDFARAQIEYPLGNGGFTALGGYAFSARTPSPWCNVMSDGKIGCVISDLGGFTFAGNSRQEKLTRHSNNELNDEPGDGIILGEGGNLWSVTRHPLPRDCAYETVHYPGYSVFSCGYNAVVARQTVYVCDGVKYYDLILRNTEAVPRRIDVMCFAELVLGDHITHTSGGIVCGASGKSLWAENGELRVVLTSCAEPDSFAYFAESYRDRGGEIRVCAHLENGGCTPALAYSARLDLTPNGSGRIVFALSRDGVAANTVTADAALEKVKKTYADFGIESDEPPLKYYLQWLAYQTLVSRFTAKCGFQQVGGAVGFRDQLQDAVALLGICPDRVRAHLLDCAAHQFEAGDVLHWWHAPAIGVRTKICDDRLFLPYALWKYVTYTGDTTILEEQVLFLKDKPLAKGESSLYAYMEAGQTKRSMLEHAVRAVKSVVLSDRGLALMGSGDWNDGMDRVGVNGRGESVWCSMFLYFVAGKLSELVDEQTAHEFAALRKRLYAAVERCFDGDRYARAFTDDGAALGVASSPECKIDLLVQSWAVLSGIAVGARAQTVLETAYRLLVDERYGIIRLLDPPFSEMNVGYISEYPQGVRENGGQYTHAAVWFIWALYDAGLTEKANRLLEMILPSSHTSDARSVEKYLKEPYVLAGDVYGGELAGRGGWTWYTGAAGWLYRLIVEKYYGIMSGKGCVKFQPNLPYGKVVHLNVRLGETRFRLTVDSREKGRWKTFVGSVGFDGAALPVASLDGKTVMVQRQKPVD